MEVLSFSCRDAETPITPFERHSAALEFPNHPIFQSFFFLLSIEPMIIIKYITIQQYSLKRYFSYITRAIYIKITQGKAYYEIF